MHTPAAQPSSIRPSLLQALLWARKVRALLDRMPGAEAPAAPPQPAAPQQAALAAEQAAPASPPRQPPLAPEAVLERWVAHAPQEAPADPAELAAPAGGLQPEDAAVRDWVQRRLVDGVAAAAEGRLPWELRPPLSEAAALLEEGYILPCDEALYGRLMR